MLDIQKVELITHKTYYGDMPDEPLDMPILRVTCNDGSVCDVPSDPDNRHYVEVRHWYGAQKKKPFDFDFVG